jgi:predicted NACHT family NTPase
MAVDDNRTSEAANVVDMNFIAKSSKFMIAQTEELLVRQLVNSSTLCELYRGVKSNGHRVKKPAALNSTTGFI